ncbi:hypothetical protein K227x_45310 [Rubripirellula lacrimiformis]|uniref:Flp pilus-assembly TadG-like N-terminal domain-containing protein n=1 Tax=Rubripirellula lacrimiformis TaxID=1930273 RepID=A0A517NG67_9BACT|nr:TadG family pilus assembly protein [Rubripirellula lacrimiformis]QDT06124.1 hypothetical protein K227x_45310 [Rubripirellula lacrimiformis]
MTAFQLIQGATVFRNQPSLQVSLSGERNPVSCTGLRSRHRLGNARRGAAAVFGMVLTVGLVILAAVTIDFGQIHVADTELRRSADSAAMAGCWELFDQQVAGNDTQDVAWEVHSSADEYAFANTINSESPSLDYSDVELGRYSANEGWDTSDPNAYNAVRVTLRRQSGTNGEVPLFFGSLTGRSTQSLHTTATAAMMYEVSGFHEPSSYSENIDLLPFALDLPSWLAVLAGETDDEFSYQNGTISSTSDGLFETNLYPKGTGAPGNRGTVDIGGSNNSTNDIARQILHGISKQDFIDLGRPLAFDENGELGLNGDTGISAGVKDELASIIGKTRIIPIYTQVQGNGNNAMFTIVRFEGVRILEVKLTGKKTDKRVIIQPAKVIARHAKVDLTGNNVSSYAVTPVMLVE